MLIISSEKELYMETDLSYYYKVLGLNYIRLIDSEVMGSNDNVYSDSKKKERTY